MTNPDRRSDIPSPWLGKGWEGAGRTGSNAGRTVACAPWLTGMDILNLKEEEFNEA